MIKETIRFRRALGWTGLLLWVVLALPSCYEERLGCLDPLATDYDFEADLPCPDGCCEFPALRLRFEHRWITPDSSYVLRLDSTFRDALGQPFRLSRIRFYWSDVAFVRPDGSRLLPLDSVLLPLVDLGGDTLSQYVRRDFVLVQAGASSSLATVGPFRPQGLTDGFTASFGIAGPANRTAVTAIPTALGSSFALLQQPGRTYFGPDTGYVAVKLEFFRDTIATDTVPIVLNFFDLPGGNQLRFDFNGAVSLTEAANTIVTFRIDYQQWFSQANVRAAPEVLRQQIASQIVPSVRLVAIEAEE